MYRKIVFGLLVFIGLPVVCMDSVLPGMVPSGPIGDPPTPIDGNENKETRELQEAIRAHRKMAEETRKKAALGCCACFYCGSKEFNAYLKAQKELNEYREPEQQLTMPSKSCVIL